MAVSYLEAHLEGSQMRPRRVAPRRRGRALDIQLIHICLWFENFADGIGGRIEKIDAVRWREPRPKGVGVIQVERNILRSVEVGCRKTADLVGAGNRELIGDQRRCKIVTRAGGKTEDLLIRTSDVLAVLHIAGVVERGDPTCLRQGGARIIGVDPGAAIIVEVGKQSPQIGHRSGTQAVVDAAAETVARPVVFIFPGVQGVGYGDPVSARSRSSALARFNVIDATSVPVVAAAQQSSEALTWAETLARGPGK